MICGELQHRIDSYLIEAEARDLVEAGVGDHWMQELEIRLKQELEIIECKSWISLNAGSGDHRMLLDVATI